MLTVGGVVWIAAIDTLTEAELVLPAASNAVAITTWLPGADCAEFGAIVHVKPHGASVLIAITTPSIVNWTLVTPTLSEAAAVTVTAPATGEPLAGKTMLTVGGVVSMAAIDTLTEAELVLPAASNAVAITVWLPGVDCAEFGAIVHVKPQGAAVLIAITTPSIVNWTLVTPTLSDAAALTVTAPVTGEPLAGETMLTVGGVVSMAAIDTLTEAELVLPAASNAVAVTTWLPGADCAEFGPIVHVKPQGPPC